MAKGEEYEHNIKCSHCGRDGLVIVTKLDTKMVGVSQGFSYRGRNVSCDTCGIDVLEITD